MAIGTSAVNKELDGLFGESALQQYSLDSLIFPLGASLLLSVSVRAKPAAKMWHSNLQVVGIQHVRSRR